LPDTGARPGRSAARRILRGEGLRRCPRAALRGGPTISAATSPAAYLAPERFEPPFLALIASGGHTLLLDVPARGRPVGVLARTLDDAAGEAFDKGARNARLGYPAGPALSRLAARVIRAGHAFPVGRGRTSRSPGSRPRCCTDARVDLTIGRSAQTSPPHMSAHRRDARAPRRA